jgi:hypothetical protein
MTDFAFDDNANYIYQKGVGNQMNLGKIYSIDPTDASKIQTFSVD